MKLIAILFLVGFLLIGSTVFDQAYSLQQVAGKIVIQLNPGESEKFNWTLRNEKSETTTVEISVSGDGSEFLSFPKTVDIPPEKFFSVEFTASVPSDYSKDIVFKPDLYSTEFGEKLGSTVINVQMHKILTLVIGNPPKAPQEETTQAPVITEETPEIVEEPQPKALETTQSEPICGEGTVLKDGICVPDIKVQQNQEKRGGGCLIATAAYGSELAHQVQFLREVRDNTLFSTTSGATFMTSFNQFYYSFSPTIADWERENLVFREGVKLFITPMISTLSIMTLADEGSEEQVVGFGISVIALNLGMYIAVPAAIAYKIKRSRN